MSITLCMIIRGEPEHLRKCLDSVHKYVDEICLTDTGLPGETDHEQILRWSQAHYRGKVHLSTFNRETNPEAFFEDGSIRSFCRAREFNFKQAHGDWVLWLDSDDVLRYAERLEGLTKVADQHDIHGFFFRYWYMVKDGQPIERHWKLQFVRRDAPIEWRGNIHEDILAKGNVRLSKIEDIVRVHENGNINSEEKTKRNLRILIEDLKEQGDKPDPRTLFYLARAFLMMEQWNEAIPLLEKYTQLSGWPEETCEALYLLAECYLRIGKHKDAVQVCLSAIELRPDFPDCFTLLGRIYLDLQDWKKAENWFKKGLAMKVPPDEVTNFAERYTTQPLAGLAVALVNLGKIDEASVCAKKALEISGNDENVKKLLEMVTFLKKRQEVGRAYVMISGYLRERGRDWSIPTLLGTAPDDMQADPLIGKIRAEWCPPKKWPKNSVAIMAFGAVEAWSPLNEKEGGIGGSEEAVLNLSRELAREGYDVTVFTNTGANDGDYDGVHWKMFTEFNAKDEFDTLIIWRQPSLADYKFNANTVLFDMHDVPFYGDWSEKRLANVKKLMVKSKYHRSLLPEVPDDKIVIVGNGINLEHFKGTEKREPFRCVYSSAIDRGLDILLETIWPRIKKDVPEATLHVYYGFRTFEELNKHNPERMAYMEKIKRLLEETDGVVYHGRVDHETLAREYEKSDVWLYPTYFPEIHCITALKAQKAGAIPVCTDYAALDETVQNGVKVSGDIYLPEVQDEFVEKAVSLLKDPARKESIRATMHEWADKNSWREVAKTWKSVISQ